ncbi:MAG: hypothetical protein ABH829_03025 [archaeon]
MKKELEAYVSGSMVMLVWQVILLKIFGIGWTVTGTIAVASALLFFIVSVLIFESRELKGGV